MKTIRIVVYVFVVIFMLILKAEAQSKYTLALYGDFLYICVKHKADHPDLDYDYKNVFLRKDTVNSICIQETYGGETFFVLVTTTELVPSERERTSHSKTYGYRMGSLQEALAFSKELARKCRGDI